MIITCEQCDTSFNLDDSLIKETGAKVRCSKCKHVFTVYPQALPPEAAEPIIEDISEPKTETPEDTSEAAPTAEAEAPAADEPGMDIDKMLITDGDLETEPEPGLDIDMPDLDIEPDFSPEAAKEPEEIEIPEEIDFSELEKFAAMDKPQKKVSEPEATASDEELELTLEDTTLDNEVDTDVFSKKGEPESDDLLDFSEPKPKPETPDDLDLDLDFTLEEDIEPEKAEPGIENSDDLEVTRFEDDFLEVAADEVQPETEEVDLGYGIEADQQQQLFEDDTAPGPAYEKKGGYGISAAMDRFTDGLDEDEEPEIEPEEAESFETPPKKKISTLVWVLIALVIVVGGGYGAYSVLDMMKVKIPFISDLRIPFISDMLGKPAKDTGTLQINTIDLNSKFVENTKAGRLFIITGKVKNGSGKARGLISITGKLYTKDKTPVKEETVFCGNILSDLELTTLDMETVKKRLANRFGDRRSNLKLNPGQELPFMIVFSNFPDDLEEFTIELAGSSPA